MKSLEREHKLIIVRCVISAILLAIAISIKTIFIVENRIILILLFALPYLSIGFDILWKAIKNIFRFEIFDECFLMSLATLGAFAIEEYSEAVAVMLFYRIGELLQDIAVDKSRSSVKALLDLKSETACVLRNGKEETISPDEISIGETIIIRPGERIPLDGIVSEGYSTLNTSAITGESMPKDVTVGESVLSGCINLTSLLKINVTCVYSDSTVARIIELTEHATERKAKTESFIRKFAHFYTPCVVIGALLLAVIPPLYFSGNWSEWLNRALVFLVVSCPCALVVSIPLTFFSGIGHAAKKGILIKGSNGIESLAKVKTFMFDKTGTLTEGIFEVCKIQPYNISEDRLIHIAATAESYSDHPISRAIVKAYGKEIDKQKISDLTEFAGRGIKVQIDGKTVLAGNEKLIQPPKDFLSNNTIGSVVHVSENGVYLGYIVVSDKIKSEAKQTIAAFKKKGVKTVMLTGDNVNAARFVGNAIGIDEVHASLLPTEKVDIIEKHALNSKVNIAFVGDGINDAYALAVADVGIAMGKGSDAAIESADAVIVSSSPYKALETLCIARKTVRIARQNVVFSLAVKAFVLVTGALGLSGMWLAVFADVGVTLIAVLNATRMLYTKKEQA